MNLNDRINAIKSTTTRSESVNEGLRTYMLSVYNFMGSGVLLTGVIAMIFFKLASLKNIIAITPVKRTPEPIKL